MTLDANRLAMSFGIVATILWTLCSALVALFPGPMMSITEYMFHVNLEDMVWALTFAGFVIGLVSWSVSAAVTGWLIGWFYNLLNRAGVR